MSRRISALLLSAAFSLSGHLPAGTWSRPLTPRGSPQSSRRSPQTLKRSRVTTNLQALPTGTKLTDKKGQHWTLGALQTRDDQGILYEGTCCSSAQGKHHKDTGGIIPKDSNLKEERSARAQGSTSVNPSGQGEQSSSDQVPRNQRKGLQEMTKARGDHQGHTPVASFL